jgi:hypothetical protein
MSSMQPMPQVQPTAQANIAAGPNVNAANNMVQGNQMFVKQNPALAAVGVASGSQDTFNTLAATSHMIAIANALDDHIATYNSAAWMRNALKSVPDVSSALVPNMIETLQASRAVQ